MASTHAIINGQCDDTIFQSKEAWDKSPLWSVLIGHTSERLDRHLDELELLLRNLYENHALYGSIKSIVPTVSEYVPDTKGLVCKRALLLVALNREKEIASYFINEEHKLGHGIGPTRVALLLLDALIPAYLNDFCQDPDVLVHRCTQMLAMGWGCELWESESIAHRNAAVQGTAQ